MGLYWFEATGPLLACWTAALQGLGSLLILVLNVSAIKLNICLLLSKHFLYYTLKILYMIPPDHCFGVGMMMLWFAGCSSACRRLWMSQSWSSYPYLKQSSLEVHTLQKSAWPSALGHLLISCLLSSLLGIYCGNLQYTEELYHYSWKCLHQPLQIACLEFHKAIPFLGTVLASTQSTWCIAWLCILCQCSYLSITLILSQEAISSWPQCGCCATGPISASAKQIIQLYICPSLPNHWSLQDCVLLASIHLN